MEVEWKHYLSKCRIYPICNQFQQNHADEMKCSHNKSALSKLLMCDIKQVVVELTGKIVIQSKCQDVKTFKTFPKQQCFLECF